MKKTVSKKHCVWFLKRLSESVDAYLLDVRSAVASDSKKLSQAELEWLDELAAALRRVPFLWLTPVNWPVVLLWLYLLQSEKLKMEFQCDLVTETSRKAFWNFLIRDLQHTEIFQRCQILDGILLQSHDGSDCLRFQSIQAEIGERDLLEWFLATTQPTTQKTMRYYATPTPVVDAMIQLIDQGLRDSTGIGLLDHRTPVDLRKIVDPAAGSCIFPRRLLRHMAERVEACRTEESDNAQGNVSTEQLAETVQQNFLNRLTAIDKDPLAAMTGSLFVALELLAVGVSLDSLAGWSVQEADALDSRFADRSYSIVVGNPPYATLTDSAGQWIEQLLNGDIDGISYREVPSIIGASQKHWLHDDYVRFIRLGHYWIRKAGGGAMCFVCNRGFLDNPGFQAMRWQLSHEFSNCCFIDLQHSARDRARNERASEKDNVDETVFKIGSGVAIGLWAGPYIEIGDKDERSTADLPEISTAKTFRFCKLEGTRSQKLHQLKTPEFVEHSLDTTDWNWTPSKVDQVTLLEYQQGISIDQIYAESWSTVVTARDRIVVDFDRCRLLERLEKLADENHDSETLRKEMFARTRSPRYPKGDTRSWKLDSARETLRSDPNWQQKVMPCLYRPMDLQWVFYDSAWIDWHREKDVDSLLNSGSLGLIVRRAAPVEDRYCYFGLTCWPTIDGILRSDNRGNETVFNLYRRNGSCNVLEPIVGRLKQSLCLSTETVLPVADRLSCWRLGDPLLVNEFRAGRFVNEMVLCWVYQHFSRPEFQRRFATCLSNGLPRMILPSDRDDAEKKLITGQERIALELAGQHRKLPQLEQQTEFRWTNADFHVSRKLIRHDERSQSLYINQTNALNPISGDMWHFRQGTHQVLQKFIKTRSGHVLDQSQILSLLHLVEKVRGIVDWETRN